MRRSIHFFLTGLVIGCLTITGTVQASDLAQRTEEILSRFQSDDFEEVKMNYCSKLLDKQKVKEAEAYLAKETGGATIGDLYHEIQCFDGSDIWSLIASNPGKYERSYEYLMEELSKAGLLRLTAEGRYKDGR